jgi:two-component system CheB/CheR fusion protein
MAEDKDPTKPAVDSGSNTGDRRPADFPIVGMGASAGGLEAFEQFFRSVPPDIGMSFVLVMHLDPGHESILTEILQRSTAMPVHEAQDQMAVAPNNVYVIPPNREMSILKGLLQLSVPESQRGQRMPIDFFLRSLAEEQGEKAIGVILSGTGTDGTLGLRAILGAGGISIVQDPATAKYNGMPSSVIQSDLATYTLPVDKMPEQLMNYVQNLFDLKIKPPDTVPAPMSSLNKILQVIRSKTGHDFSLYKQNTVGRRIERRMMVHNIADTEIYARYLKEHPEEAQLLFKELLINVTSFFRDAESFDVLKKDLLPQLLADKPESHIFRAWVVGCATGEEAYSIAILLREYMEETKQEFKAQIYSTDIDEDAIALARTGSYPANIAMDVAEERLRRFFIKEETGYRIKKDIREMVVFAVQDVIKDPPFTKLDLVSCRNLLIYLEPELQNRIIPVFHYALKPGGALFLSSSESIGSYAELFAPISRKWKIYKAKASAAATRTVMTRGLSWNATHPGRGPDEVVPKMKEPNFAELSKRALLQSFAPASVITDEGGNLLYVHGDTGKYLRPSPGQPSLNIIEMAREGLQTELRTAINNVAAQKTQVVRKGVNVKTNGGRHGVTLIVRSIADPQASQPLLIISFQDIDEQEKPARKGRSAAKKDKGRTEELEQELSYTKETLQATIEESQASNEELKSANEELQSTNEELQSTNEELETSKEELQSINEELVTLNSELQAKIEELAVMHNDMKNFLDNMDIGTIFLNERFLIRRFTAKAAKVFRLLASDLGRPLGDITSNLVGDELLSDAREVLDSLVPREKAVQATSNEWYTVRILPYRTLDNVIDGVVLTFTDITELKKIESEMQMARDYAEDIVDTVREPLIILDGEMKVVSANRSFYERFLVQPGETIGRYLYDLGNRQWDIPRLRELLETILPEKTSFDNFEIEHEFPAIGRRKMILNARCILNKMDKTQSVLLAIEDITDLLQLNEQLRLQVAELDAFAYSVSHDLRAPLRHMMGFVKLLQQRMGDCPDVKALNYADTISEASKKMDMLIDDLLKFSKLGRSELQKRKVDLNAVIKEVLREIQVDLKEREIGWEIDEMPYILGDPQLLRIVMINLISNAVKFTKTRPRAEIKIACKDEGDKFTCSVNDNGVGFDMKYVDRLFGVFQRLHTRNQFEGTGIGLANVQRIIARHGGRVWAEGAVGQGATFYFTLPKATQNQ